MNVRIRKEQNWYLAYFPAIRRILGVNETGATVLDRFFNTDKGIEEIASEISPDSRHHGEVTSDIRKFLTKTSRELEPDRFNDMERIVVSRPIGAELEITASCNLRCIHCLQQKHYPRVFMPLDRAKQIVNVLNENGVCEVSLIGGEPFLHAGLADLAEHADNLGMAVGITTNGTVVTDNHVERLGTLSNLSIAVSLDGPTQIHDKIRGDGSFSKTDLGIRKLLQANIETEVMFTVNSLNIEHAQPVLDYCKGLDIACNFNLFKAHNRESHMKLLPNPSSFFTLIRRLFELRRSDGYKIGLSNSAIVSRLLGRPVMDECKATQSGITIDVHERIITCPSLVYCGYYNGTVFPRFDENFVEIWKHHPVMREFRSNGLRGCQARSFMLGEDIKGNDPYDVDAFVKNLRR